MEPIDEWVNSKPPYLAILPTDDTTRPPKGYHYDPYSKAWRRNLTEAHVQSLWPYAKPKEKPVRDKHEDWLEDALNQVAPKPAPDEMLSAPVRMLGPEDNATPPPPADNVVLPKHYARFKIEPIRFCIENGLNGFQFNIIKYVLRHDAKNGLEDLRKARRYLDMFIKYVEGDPDWWRAG